MKRYIKSESQADFIREHQNKPEGGYLYIFKHGIGPGTIPRDVEIVRTKDLPNYYTAVWLDRFLTTSELKQYDIPSETRINELLGRIGYCQKNGDVVPCDDVDACDNITASNSIDTGSDFTVIQEIYDDGYVYMTEENVEPVYIQEYGVNLGEVLAICPRIFDGAMKGWTDETFKAGDIITEGDYAAFGFIKRVVGGEQDQMYSDFKAYVKQHPEFPDPTRHIEIRINNPKCLPSAAEERRKQGEELGKRLGQMLGLRRY